MLNWSGMILYWRESNSILIEQMPTLYHDLNLSMGKNATMNQMRVLFPDLWNKISTSVWYILLYYEIKAFLRDVFIQRAIRNFIITYF